MTKVLLISPPYMQLSHPSYKMPIALTKGCEYMNPGLLISSAILDENNIDNKIIKINDIKNMSNIDKEITSEMILAGISCTCAWEYLESLKIAEYIKSINPNIKIVLAGWQVKSIKTAVFDDSKNIDYIILGDAEYTIKELYDNIYNNKDTKIFSVIRRQEKETEYGIKNYPEIKFTKIDFSKYPDYGKYLPYVEESRNCPYSCQFCLNSCVGDRYQNTPLDVFIENVSNVEKLYGKDANAILLAANFGVNPKETKKKLEYLKSKKMKWNIELHVDNNWEEYIEDLSAAGINKASIGFESGSTTILRLMNKTKDPERYLKRLEEMLIKLNEQGIQPSLNLLFDYRETRDTIRETLEYLNKNKDMIKKVKANFMYVFEGIFKNIDFDYEPNIIIDDYGKKIHAYPVLPKGMDLEKMSILVDEIESGNYSSSLLDNYPKCRKLTKEK